MELMEEHSPNERAHKNRDLQHCGTQCAEEDTLSRLFRPPKLVCMRAWRHKYIQRGTNVKIYTNTS